jgi:hypothetical protein
VGQDGKRSRSEVLRHHTERWRQMSGVVEKLLAEEQ